MYVFNDKHRAEMFSSLPPQMNIYICTISLSPSLVLNDQWELKRRENHQLVQLARVRYELMIRLIFTLLGERNEYIIRYDEKRKKKEK
jgi:hypothetical protein